jgi:hypothetical protein
MGTLRWQCTPGQVGQRTYRLVFDARSASASEQVTMRAGKRVVLSRFMSPPVRITSPITLSPVRTVTVTQTTEPGTLRAVARINFGPGRVSPSHCWPWLPPAFTVRVFAR